MIDKHVDQELGIVEVLRLRVSQVGHDRNFLEEV
jgi:hypothetical protein